MPQGSSINVPGVYVVIYNESNGIFHITMTTAVKIDATDNLAPPGVTVNLSSQSFDLQPSTSEMVKVWLDVSQDAVPGDYMVEVNAQASADQGGGQFVVVGAAGQRAPLTVTGEYGTVTVRTVSPGGEPVATEVRLFKVIDDLPYEVAYAGGGVIQAARVSPGRFRALAYGYYGEDLITQEFDVLPGEDKEVELVVETVYFKSFGLGDASRARAGSSGRLDLEYTITNAYQAVYNVTVRLLVTIDGASLEEIQAWSVTRLEGGDTGQSYTYAPPEEWQQATYGFRLQLYVDGLLTAETNEKTLEVSAGGAKSSLWIVFVVLGVLGAAGLGFLIFFLLKRRKKEEEKPRKAEKKRKEEKPASKAEEPVRKPEPYRPPEPVRPPPLPEEEPIVEPAPLASVSSLKARMASLGRDQGTGKATEGEPGAEGQDGMVETSPQPRAYAPVHPPPKVEPERPPVKKVEDRGQKSPASEKPAGQKPGIFSKVTATGKKEPPKPPIAQGPAPVKPENEVQINWPPKSVEPPRPPSGLGQASQPEVEAVPSAPAPEEATPAEEVATEEPAEPQSPPSRSSFAEAARLRMEARQRAAGTDKTGAAPEGSPTEGNDAGGGEDGPPST